MAKSRAARALTKSQRLARNLVVARLNSLQSRPLPAHTAVLHLNHLDALREPFILQIFRMLKNIGLEIIYLPSTIRELIALSSLESDLYTEKLCAFFSSPPSASSEHVLVIDDEHDKLIKYAWKRTLVLEFNLARSQASFQNPVFVPYPDRTVGYRTNDMYTYRNARKQMRVLFAGSFHGYRNRAVKTILGMNEREEIVETFRNFPLTVTLRSRAELEQVLSGARGSDGFYFLDTDFFRVPQEDWLRVLGTTNVFLCPPGIYHPMSHNAVEAMGLGVIPLLNYPEWFHPSLENGINCICFQSIPVLLRKLEEISRINGETLSMLQQNALSYYERYLDPIVFAENLRARIESPSATDTTNLVMTTEINGFFPYLTERSLLPLTPINRPSNWGDIYETVRTQTL